MIPGGWILWAIIAVVTVIFLAAFKATDTQKRRKIKAYERSLKMIAMLIHLPPSTDDVQGGGRDARDVLNEEISQAQVMYSIIASSLAKGRGARVFGQKHFSFEIVAKDGQIKYYALVPSVSTELVKQAVQSTYPTARLEETERPNFFSREGKAAGVAGGELNLKKEYVYPISTYEDSKRDASLALLNAMSTTKGDEGVAVQILFRPTSDGWIQDANTWVKNLREGNKNKKHFAKNFGESLAWFVRDLMEALWRPPEMHEHEDDKDKPLSDLQEEEIAAIENKTKFPAFETLVRIVASSKTKERSEAMIGGVVAAFAQFDSPNNNGFKYEIAKDGRKLAKDYIFRFFPLKTDQNILNSVELASLFHLPSQAAIPNSQVERQMTKQVDGPAKLVEEGILLGVNEFRGEQKEIRLSENDRRRHTYVIGATGMGKSVFLGNIAYQDMMDGRGFAFIDPHGDVVEDILSKVPPERIDDVIYFDPGDMDNPIGMNMFEFESPDQKDFIIQEGINMLYSLYDPGHTGIFGPRGEHMFRNAALLLMSDPKGATFIDIPRVFVDPEFVKEKLQYVTDKTVYDYWTKEFPASQKSNDAGEVTTWFVSKWGPFLSNTMMRNILGQTRSGFNLRDIMDNKKILLVNLSKGKMGELNSKLLGMIFVMKFQTAAMARVDTPEEKRKDFCLFVDEFQNFSTESFESILSEARKFRLNLIVANQFMTQLTDKIREGILGNVGTIISGRLGVTDADLMEKAFQPVFNAEDLHKLPNHQAIATVMMYGVPSSPFTMKLLPPMGEGNAEVLKSLKGYSATRYGRTRAEVDREINARLASAPQKTETKAQDAPVSSPEAQEGGSEPKADSEGFLEKWEQKKADLGAREPEIEEEKPAEDLKKEEKQSILEEEKYIKLR